MQDKHQYWEQGASAEMPSQMCLLRLLLRFVLGPCWATAELGEKRGSFRNCKAHRVDQSMASKALQAMPWPTDTGYSPDPHWQCHYDVPLSPKQWCQPAHELECWEQWSDFGPDCATQHTPTAALALRLSQPNELLWWLHSDSKIKKWEGGDSCGTQQI